MKLKNVYIAEDPMDPSSYEENKTENLIDFLMTRFNGSWPETARLYHGSVCKENDVTPDTQLDVDRLIDLEGDFYVVVYPAGPVVVAIFTNILISFVTSIVMSFLFAPSKPKSPTQTNRQTSSSNNQLSDRANRARINNRIPDIYGTVLSIPDLISLPYKVYKNHQQVELSFMCVGRGHYSIAANDVKEAETRISEIAGSSVEIYAPFTSPKNTSTPQLRIGSSIGEELVRAVEISSVNGQTLRPPNSSNVRGLNNIRFIYPDTIAAELGSGIDFTTRFAPSDTLEITEATVNSLDLSGSYVVVSVSQTDMVLSNPAAENSDWDDINSLPDNRTDWFSPVMETSGPKWIGPFFIDVPDMTEISTNFIAVNGLFKDNGRTQTRFDVTIEVEVTPVDISGEPIGLNENFTTTIFGSSTSRDARAVTLRQAPSFTGRCKVRARRLTNADLTFQGSVVDEVKWERIYAISPIQETDFGNITTVYSQTYATAGALSVADRRLNMRVTRKLPARISGSTFTEELFPTNSADDIISAICLDQQIGNRSVSEVDFDSIYNTIQEVKDYFGNDKAGEFSYTFDDDNVSFEEILGTIAGVCFCTAYRQGNILRLFFEKSTEDSTILFNHRNKIPETEKRTISFGNFNNNDGVELEFISPIDDLTDTYFIPADRSAINPIKVETAGVRTFEQAFWLAWRTWNKIRYQNVSVEFDATEEAAVCINKERILVADNTRNTTQDGEVLAQNILELTLSQKVMVEEDKEYVIFLQHYDGSLESIPITVVDKSNKVVLAYAPRQELSLSRENFARTTYVIQTTDDPNQQAFLLSEKDPSNKDGVFTLRATNYTPLYYQQDNLVFWLSFSKGTYEDDSPYQKIISKTGDSEIVEDLVRGFSHKGSFSTDYVEISSISPPETYTKMCWVKKNSSGTIGHILSSETGDAESFFITSDGQLISAHGSSQVSYNWPNYDEWNHAAVTYEAETTTMKLYVNGVLVEEDDEIEQRTIGNLTAFANSSSNPLLGLAQDLRLYNRVLSPDEIKQIYRASLT